MAKARASVLGSMAAVMLLGGTAAAADGETRHYLVEFNAKVPADLDARVGALGGTVVDTFPPVRVAAVGGLTPEGARALASHADVADVTEDEPLVRPSRPAAVAPMSAAASALLSPSLPEAAAYYAMQWDKRVIGADKAWQTGHLGSPDVRIAIIDTGIDPTHPEVAPLIDWSRSASFCAGEDALVEQEFPGYPAWTDLHGHGTFVASIASSRGELVAGVNSRATLMALKVLGIGSCPGSGIFRAIAHAADNGADVINLSIVARPDPKAGQRGFAHYYQLFVQYALVKGVSAVVVAAGNWSLDLDHSGNGFARYCDVPGVICVSATGATDSGPTFTGPFVAPDTPAFYTNYGSSAIHVGAPGGNASFDATGQIVGVSFVFGACASTDRAMEPDGSLVPGFCSAGGYQVDGWAGTSAAAPQVAGLAALLVAQLGHGLPAQVRAAIETSADDRGKPGVDPYFGKGRINVPRALGIE